LGERLLEAEVEVDDADDEGDVEGEFFELVVFGHH
jgi:hypothetical protein